MKKKLYSYKDSGVNISLGNKFVDHIGRLTKKMSKKRKIISFKIILVHSDLCMIFQA